MEDRLYKLTTADDPAVYSDEHDISLENGEVAVTIRLSGTETAVPDEYVDTVTARHEDRVDAIVAVDDLLPLAEHDAVEFISRRQEPHHP